MAQIEKQIDPQVIEAEENFLIDFQFLVQDLIESKRVSRGDLAKRAGISKSRLSQLLNAEANPSVKTFGRLFHALNAKVELNVVSSIGRSSCRVRNGDLRSLLCWRAGRSVGVVARLKRPRLKTGVRPVMTTMS